MPIPPALPAAPPVEIPPAFDESQKRAKKKNSDLGSFGIMDEGGSLRGTLVIVSVYKSHCGGSLVPHCDLD